ncbi:MAG: hypothetical protein HY810_01040 [Candidatus Omnitrophica bacterium]|nr:hypothetical protein [Candidatus Omnitrophota bacterium]
MSQAHLAQADGRVPARQKHSMDLPVALFFSEKIGAERKILRLLYATNGYVIFITLIKNKPFFPQRSACAEQICGASSANSPRDFCRKSSGYQALFLERDIFILYL